jgi:hypothetical protein
MFSDLFEERDKTITHLVKLGDCLGRSLRENTSLFSIDSQANEVSYLTTSDKVITGKYSIAEDITIDKIVVQDSSVFQDGEKFDSFVNDKIHSFVEGVHYGEYATADSSFEDILSLWENRLKLGSIQNRLAEKGEKLSNIERILESDEFKNLVEVTPQLQTFLKENLEKVTSVPEIRNGVNLSNAVSTAFSFPRLTLEQLVEGKSYSLKNGVNESVYEMICRQELVKRELVESKKSFDTVWANNSAIRKLSSMIFEDDESVVTALSEALREVPYLSLASKRSLFNTFTNCLANADGIGVSEKDIQNYASRIFEYKKDVKEVFINTVNEKYGVNIQNLQDPASFKSLANTQVVIFEALSRLAPKGSVLKQVLSEMGLCLKSKSGVECIDVNDFLMEMFVSVGYDTVLEEADTKDDLPKVNFKRVSRDLLDIQDLVMTLKQKVQDQEYPSDENLAPEEEAPAPAPEAAPEEMPPEEAPAPAPEAAPAPEEMPPEEMPPEEAGAEEMPPEPKTQDEVIQDLANLEDMVADIAAELGMDTAEPEEDTPKEETE